MATWVLIAHLPLPLQPGAFPGLRGWASSHCMADVIVKEGLCQGSAALSVTSALIDTIMSVRLAHFRKLVSKHPPCIHGSTTLWSE